MFIPICRDPNNRITLGYLLWRWLFRKYGTFIAKLDAYYLGPSRGLNDYDSLAGTYKKSDIKPDKQYSILPTVLEIVGDCKNKVIIDVGCGAGFFALAFAERGAKVYGVDNSKAQLKAAREISQHKNIQYVLSDIFVDHVIPVDIIVAPFVVNYARTVPILRHFFQKIYQNLRENGKVVFVIDLPNGNNLQKFGTTKSFVAKQADEAVMQIDLFNEGKKICTLNAIYFSPQTIERTLSDIGFKNITWHTPIISEEGVNVMGVDFWNGYVEDPELGYISAEK